LGVRESSLDRRGPAELVLAAAVARRHYLYGQSKIEIADELGLSRFKVARLIDFARESGIVRIEIVADGDLDLDRSARLQERFGLRHAVVLDGSAIEPASLNEHLGAAAARLLSEILTADDVLGLPWSRSVDLMTRSLRDLPRVDVVQLSGAMEVEGHDGSAVDIVRRAARATGGGTSIFYAPLLLDDASGVTALKLEPQVARVLAQASRVTTAVMGIGAWGPGLSTIFDAMPATDRAEIRQAGVVGELAGLFFDRSGRIVEPPQSGRIVTVAPDALQGIRDLVAIAAGAPKAEAVGAALTGRLVNTLVTDGTLADALLAMP
jgi:DNA-binding transcriptional regulator LsrR (DeoR family)